MAGHCDFCGIWHSGSCCHPGRAKLAELERELASAVAERDRYRYNWEASNRNWACCEDRAERAERALADARAEIERMKGAAIEVRGKK